MKLEGADDVCEVILELDVVDITVVVWVGVVRAVELDD